MSLILDALRRRSRGREGHDDESPPTARADAVLATLGYPRRQTVDRLPLKTKLIYGASAVAIGFVGLSLVIFYADAAGGSGASGGRAGRYIGCGAACKSGKRIGATDRGASGTEGAGSGSRESHCCSASTERHSGGGSGLETAGRGAGRGTGSHGGGRVAVEHASRDVNVGAKA